MDALLQAIKTKDRSKVYSILQKNQIDLTNEDAPFIRAIETHQMTILHFLLKYDPNIKDRCNRMIKSNYYIGPHSTLLGLSALTDNPDMALMLLEGGADPNIRDINGQTPLYIAIRSRNVSMVSLLLYYGADITMTVNEEIPLITAIKHRRLSIIRKLLEAKGYINEYNHCHALHHAITTEYVEIIKLLLETKFNVNEQNGDGDTPLHWAIRDWSVCHSVIFKGDMFEIIKLLLEFEADFSIPNNHSITARMITTELEDLFALYEITIKEPE